MSTDAPNAPNAPQAPMAPPTGEARFFAGLALAVTLGFAVWMATLPGALDTLWIFVVAQAIPLIINEWRGFRAACLGIGGLYVPLAIVGALFGWFLLLPAAALLFIAGGSAKPAPPEPWQQWQGRRPREDEADE